MPIRYLGVDNEWKERWPDTETLADPAIAPSPLPKAVEITLDHEMFGPIVWLFQLPQ